MKFDLRRVKIKDLEKSNEYPKHVLDSLKRRKYDDLKIFYSPDELNDPKIMEPILYSIKNELDTYVIFEYCGEFIQRKPEIAEAVIKTEPNLIEGTILSEDKDFIKRNLNENPNLLYYMSDDLKNDSNFIKECSEIENNKVKTIIMNDPELSKDKTFIKENIKDDPSIVLVCDDSLKNDYGTMKELCEENAEVIDYVASNTDMFGKEGLEATKDAVKDKFYDDSLEGFEERLTEIKEQKEKQNEMTEKDIDELTKEEKRMQRHIRFIKELKEKVDRGEKDPAEVAKKFQAICKNMDPEYKKMLGQYLGIDEAIKEKDEKEKTNEDVKENENDEKNKENLNKAYEDKVVTMTDLEKSMDTIKETKEEQKQQEEQKEEQEETEDIEK